MISMNTFSISACGKGGEWHFAFYLRISFISACGSWQWPLRGIRIGEAKNPGPPKSSRWNEENEEHLFNSGPEPIESPIDVDEDDGSEDSFELTVEDRN